MVHSLRLRCVLGWITLLAFCVPICFAEPKWVRLDSSHFSVLTDADEQKAQVEKVLAELDVSKKPVIEVLNKIDLVEDGETILGAPGSVAVSALKKIGLDNLLAAIDQALVADPVIEMNLRLPQSEGAILAALEAGAIVDAKRFEGNLAYISARGPASLHIRPQ